MRNRATAFVHIYVDTRCLRLDSARVVAQHKTSYPTSSLEVAVREIGAFEAKTHLSELLAAAEAGESILITRRGTAVARLVPAGQGGDRASALARVATLRRRLGSMVPLTSDEILSARDEGRR